MTSRATRLLLQTIQAWDRLRLRVLERRFPGLEIDSAASSNFASCDFRLGPGARLRIGPGAVTERRAGGVRFHLEAGAEVVIGAGTWLRSDLGPVILVAFEGARIETGPECFLNGCHLSAKQRVELGRRAWVGPGSRVWDSDQHDFDTEQPEQTQPVILGDHTWIASDVTVLRGVEIGEHSVVGTRSLVTRSIPAHTLAFGVPAVPRGKVGDRSATR